MIGNDLGAVGSRYGADIDQAIVGFTRDSCDRNQADECQGGVTRGTEINLPACLMVPRISDVSLILDLSENTEGLVSPGRLDARARYKVHLQRETSPAGRPTGHRSPAFTQKIGQRLTKVGRLALDAARRRRCRFCRRVDGRLLRRRAGRAFGLFLRRGKLRRRRFLWPRHRRRIGARPAGFRMRRLQDRGQRHALQPRGDLSMVK